MEMPRRGRKKKKKIKKKRKKKKRKNKNGDRSVVPTLWDNEKTPEKQSITFLKNPHRLM